MTYINNNWTSVFFIIYPCEFTKHKRGISVFDKIWYYTPTLSILLDIKFKKKMMQGILIILSILSNIQLLLQTNSKKMLLFFKLSI